MLAYVQNVERVPFVTDMTAAAPQTDKWNRFLVTADQAGYVKLWDIATFDPAAPAAAQVRAVAVWRAHRTAVTGLDLVPYPRPGENLSQFMAGHEASDYVVVTAARDRRALVWSCDGACVGRLGQQAEWSLEDRGTWASPRPDDAAATEHGSSDSDRGSEDGGADGGAGNEPEDEGEVDVLALLDERLRPKKTVQGLPPVPIDEVRAGRRRALRIVGACGFNIIRPQIQSAEVETGRRAGQDPSCSCPI